MPRPRKHNPTIPAHIDQRKIPKGVYWDSSGNGRWYVLEFPRKAVTVASSKRSCPTCTRLWKPARARQRAAPWAT